MKTLRFSETSETIQPSTQVYIPESPNPQPHRFENLILHKRVICGCYKMCGCYKIYGCYKICGCYKINHTMQFYDFIQKLDHCSANLRQQLTAEFILLSTKHRYLQALWLQTTLFFVR
jgi:hypothetical protein